MPVAVKFSEGFYDRFSHEAVDELVNFLNGLDSGYRAELKELNEQNFARFDDKLERRVVELRSEIDMVRSALEKRMDVGFATLKADLLKWMFVFIASATLAILRLG